MVRAMSFNRDVTASVRPEFPSANQLVIAMHQRHRGTDSPLVQWACQLYGLYGPDSDELSDEERLAQIDDVIRTIDQWIAVTAPRPFGGARVAEHTVGVAVAKLAKADIYAFAHGCTGVSGEQAGFEVWDRHSQLIQALDDLLVSVQAGKQNLPMYLPEIDRLGLADRPLQTDR